MMPTRRGRRTWLRRRLAARRPAVRARIAGMSGGIRVGAAVAVIGGSLTAVGRRARWMIGRRLAAAEHRALAGVNEDRFRAKRRLNFDDPFEDVERRFARVV